MKELIAIIILAATSAQAQTWHRVAYDDAGTEGKQTHLVYPSGSDLNGAKLR